MNGLLLLFGDKFYGSHACKERYKTLEALFAFMTGIYLDASIFDHSQLIF